MKCLNFKNDLKYVLFCRSSLHLKLLYCCLGISGIFTKTEWQLEQAVVSGICYVFATS